MRYIGLEEFLKMPPGTVYMEHTDVRDDGVINQDTKDVLKIKGETTPGVYDWAVFDLVEMKDNEDDGAYAGLMHSLLQRNGNVPVDDEPIGCRYGMYPNPGEIFFFVLDEKDTRAVIGLLEMALEWRGADVASPSSS